MRVKCVVLRVAERVAMRVAVHLWDVNVKCVVLVCFLLRAMTCCWLCSDSVSVGAFHVCARHLVCAP